jgi:nucleoside-diphosphate-sugar epimerase
MDTGKTIFIVGGAGYIGEMLCDLFNQRDDVRQIIALDKEPQSDYSKQLAKVVHIQHNMADDGWQEEVAKYEPDTVIHTAWQIRAMYGKRKPEPTAPPKEEYERLAAQRRRSFSSSDSMFGLDETEFASSSTSSSRSKNEQLNVVPQLVPASLEQWRWNVEGSDKIFDFAFTQLSVKKLIYFSTASSYSARCDNTFTHFFTEEEGFRDDDYIYAKEKKVAEERLCAKYEQYKKEGKSTPQIFIVRPAAITGPRGRYMRIRFGLQSALQGNLKGGFVNKVVTTLTSFVPATQGWVRQFIHEDDVADIVTKFTFEDLDGAYEVFNITPQGEPVFAQDMADAVGKKILKIQPWMARFAFFFFWHATRGKIPTCTGSWRYYSYPVLMDGSRLTKRYGYQYQYVSKDAFRYTDGRYAAFVPEDKQNPKKA